MDSVEDSDDIFKVLKGELESNEYARFCLLVKETDCPAILAALEGSKNKCFSWSVDEDQTVTDVQVIPTSLAHPIRTIGKIPKAAKTECELLDWLIHGESYVPKKYIVLEFMDGMLGPDDGNRRAVPFEVRQENHYARFLAASWKLCVDSEADGDLVYLSGVRELDRAMYLHEFGTSTTPRVVDDELVTVYEYDAAEEDPWWAHNHRNI